MKPVNNLNDLPDTIRHIVDNVSKQVVQKIGGSFKYSKAENSDTMIFVWNGPMPNKPDTGLSLSQRIKGRTMDQEDIAVNRIVDCILTKYEAVKNITDAVAEPETKIPDTNLDSEKLEAFNLAKKILSSLGYVAVPNTEYKESKAILKLLDSYYSKEFSDEDRVPYSEILKELIKEKLKYEATVIKIEKVIHSV